LACCRRKSSRLIHDRTLPDPQTKAVQVINAISISVIVSAPGLLVSCSAIVADVAAACGCGGRVAAVVAVAHAGTF
jgi:hypothetical protein